MERDYVKNQIAEESRHYFIYGYNTQDRENLLREVEEENGISADQNKPMAIYLHDASLPVIEKPTSIIKVSTSHIIARDFLSSSMSQNIVERLINAGLHDRAQKLLQLVSRVYLQNSDPIQSLEELEAALREARDFYSKYYVESLTGENDLPDINSVRLPFLDVRGFVGYVKEMLNNNSHFSMILNRTEKMPRVSEMAINEFFSGPSDGDISMKVATDICDWSTYYGLNGQLREYVHDYGTIELDDNLKKELLRRKGTL